MIRTLVTPLLVAMSLSGCVSTLESAVQSGDYEAVRQEIASGGNIDGNYWTTIKEPMYRAIDNDDLEMVKLLHESGAKILPDFLSEAARASATSTYEYLLANGNTIDYCVDDLDYPGFWNITFVLPNTHVPPIGSAISRGNTQSILKLIELGSKVEQECRISKKKKVQFSAIMHAAYFGDPRVIRLLIRNGADPNRFVDGMTPLSIAADMGHYEAARVLLADGAFHTYSGQIKQPIEYAIEWGRDDIVDLLVYAGATRPRRSQTSEMLEKIADGLVDGVIFAAEMYVIYQGARYSGFDPTYTSDLRNTQDIGNRDNQRWVGDDDSCRSDFDCGAYEICAKKVASFPGICVPDELNSGKQSSSNYSGPSNRGADPLYQGGTACRMGYAWDLIYGGCKK